MCVTLLIVCSSFLDPRVPCNSVLAWRAEPCLWGPVGEWGTVLMMVGCLWGRYVSGEEYVSWVTSEPRLADADAFPAVPNTYCNTRKGRVVKVIRHDRGRTHPCRLSRVVCIGKTTMAIVTFMPYEWVSEWNNNRVKKRGDEYESIKKMFGHKAVEQACSIFPSIKDRVDYMSVGTPVSNNYYLGAPRGEIYGLDHTRERFSVWNNAILRAKTDIPGLYLAGQDVCSCGFIGGLYGGLFSAWAVLERNLMTDLIKIHKATKQAAKKSQ